MQRTGLTNFLSGKKGYTCFFTCTIYYYFFKQRLQWVTRPNTERRRSLNRIKHVFHSRPRNLWNPAACFSCWNAAARGTINLRADGVHTYQFVSSQLLSSLKHCPKVYCEKDNKNKDQYHRRRKRHSNTLFPSSTMRTETLHKALVHHPSPLLLLFFFGLENLKQGGHSGKQRRD